MGGTRTHPYTRWMLFRMIFERDMFLRFSATNDKATSVRVNMNICFVCFVFLLFLLNSFFFNHADLQGNKSRRCKTLRSALRRKQRIDIEMEYIVAETNASEDIPPYFFYTKLSKNVHHLKNV